jgi:tetratricopeptide (TPR) repeat protein
MYVDDKQNIFLSEILKENGYQTSAFISASVIDRDFGFNQGFDCFSDEIGEGKASIDGDIVKDRVIKYFGEKKNSGKFFTFIHFYDPHMPYNPPPEYFNKYSDFLYDGEIAFVDEMIGEILEFFEDEGLLENTLVIITSDHGEGFYEHGVSGHSDFIYETTQHVPLIFWCPGLIPANKKIPSQVRLVDIPPTILDLLGIEPETEMAGISLIDALIREKELKNLPSYCESYRCYHNFGWSKLYGLSTGEWKYILAPEPELYNLKEDPDEKDNVYNQNPEMVYELDKELTGIIQQYEREIQLETDENNISESTKRDLVTLGYVVSGGYINKGKENIDPKDKVEFLEKFHNVIYKMNDEQYRKEIEKSYLELIEMEPDISLCHKMLAEYYLKENEKEKAVKSFKKALELNPADFEIRYILSNIYFEEKDYQNAEKYIDEIIKNCKDNENFIVYANYSKGIILYEFYKRYEVSLEYFKKTIELRPNHAKAYYSATLVSFFNLKDYEQARQYANRYLQFKPDSQGAEKIELILKEIEAKIE